MHLNVWVIRDKRPRLVVICVAAAVESLVSLVPPSRFFQTRPATRRYERSARRRLGPPEENQSAKS